jgi:hypothetical protein
VTYDFKNNESHVRSDGKKVSNSSETIYFFNLKKNTIYDGKDIQVRQTDKADNEAIAKIYNKVITDDIAPEYQSISETHHLHLYQYSNHLNYQPNFLPYLANNNCH